MNLGLPLLAIVAAILTIQPTIAKSISQGGFRTIATFIGGLIGFLGVSYIGANPVIVGIAVMFTIVISARLKLQDGIAIAAITVAAVMIDVTGEPHIFALHRLIETLVGIGVGVSVNFLFSPPNAEKGLVEEVTEINQSLKNIYLTVLNGIILNAEYDRKKMEEEINEVRTRLEEVRKKVFDLKDEVGYKKPQKLQQVKRYEIVVSSMSVIFERILGIYYTEKNRAARNIDLKGITTEYQNIIETLQRLLTTTVSIQENIFCYMKEKSPSVCLYLESCIEQNSRLAANLHEQISKWHLLDQNKNNTLSLMELSNIGYEMTQISYHLKRIFLGLKNNYGEDEDDNEGSKENDYNKGIA
jgi:uncharacterized membrane protein YgaE (UPF0421/DUF939 family)